MNKKKIIIIASASLALILIIVLFVLLYQKNKTNTANSNPSKTQNVFTPDFLSAEEKTKLNIPVDAKIQAMVRDGSGAVKVYKIIKSDADITDPAKVGPISPRSNN
jgi:uncharacterized protein YpmS